mmetsp:Transcript_647/g.2194  ORF Transcript_647/g.2194 Transcript_647/m.2194 type:complete len:215 (-) Transcript_647:20-664(-)
MRRSRRGWTFSPWASGRCRCARTLPPSICAARCRRSSSRTSPAASAGASTSQRRSGAGAICCCSTSRPTTSTLIRSARSKRRSALSRARRSSSLTTAGSSTASATTHSPLTRQAVPTFSRGPSATTTRGERGDTIRVKIAPLPLPGDAWRAVPRLDGGARAAISTCQATLTALEQGRREAFTEGTSFVKRRRIQFGGPFNPSTGHTTTLFFALW